MTYHGAPAILFVGGLVAALSATPPSDYITWTAEEKVAWWNANLDVGRGGSSAEGQWWADNPAPCMHAECVHPGGFNTHMDVVPPYECRIYGIHPTGLVAWVKAVWFPNSYTGMFQKAELGFARWGYQRTSEYMMASLVSSEAYETGRPLKPFPGGKITKETNCFEYDCGNVTKGHRYTEAGLEWGERPDTAQFMALKFFRNGVASANIHTGSASLPTWNHFSRNYSNFIINYGSQVPNQTDMASMSVQGSQRGTQWPGFTGLHDMAMYDQAGRLQHQISFPNQLIFIPATEGTVPESVHGGYKRTVQFADAWGPGTVLFDIYAKDSLAAPMLQIGRLELASKVMMSADTDRQVFFYHPRYDRDIVLRPDIVFFGCQSWWTCPTCPVFHELCSPTLDFLARFRAARNNSPGGLEALSLHGRAHAERHLRDFPPWSCAGRPDPPREEKSSNGTLVQECIVSRKAKKGPRRQLLQLQACEPMRGDDFGVEPLSGLKYPKDWFCESDPEAWPNAKRPRPWTSTCEAISQPLRPQSEPEWALPADCTDLPRCSIQHGSWYSSTYPCRCGSNTCFTGQLCTAVRDECVSWGPYAQFAGQSRQPPDAAAGGP